MTQVVVTEPKVEFIYAGNRLDCATCGVVFWLTNDYEANRRERHDTFHCPNGHSLTFLAETEAERYKRLYKQADDRAAAVRAERDQAEASRRAWKGQVTKLRNRAVVGECPFCGQHLRDLARHVSRKHAEEAGANPDAEPVA